MSEEQEGTGAGRSAGRLVVTADDFGLSPGICRGIIEAHRHGIVTATSALVLAPGFADGALLLAEVPGLDVGVHLALIGEDGPAAPARDIPTLVDRRGRLAAGWRQLLPRLVAGRIAAADVRTELTAQLARARAAGIDPTHLDTHQHLHLWPSIGRVLVEVATSEGIGVVRAPRARPRGRGRVFEVLGRRLADRLDDAALRRTEAFVGWEESGYHDERALLATVARLGRCPARTTELVLHPGRADVAARQAYRWGYQWDDEVDAACSPRVRAALRRAELTLVGPSAL